MDELGQHITGFAPRLEDQVAEVPTQAILGTDLMADGKHLGALILIRGDQGRLRINQILGMLGRKLASQKAKGCDYFVGDSLSAADIYWTAFSNLMAPMPDEIVEVPEYYKAFGIPCMAAVEVPMTELFAHRDRVARDYFDTPMRF